MSQQISTTDLYKALLFFSQQVDSHDWKISDLTSKKKSLSNEAFDEVKKSYESIRLEFEKIKSLLPQELNVSCLHFEEKLQRLANRLITVQPSGSSGISHQQFTNFTSSFPSLNIKYTDLLKLEEVKKPLSFVIENDNYTPTHLSRLDRISFLFRNENEIQALNEFPSLSTSTQQLIYEMLWVVRGKPVGSDPLAHDNFGEVSLKNTESRCFSTLQQKAWAIELAKIPTILYDIITAFKNQDQILANSLFNNLPSQIQNEIFERHWIEMGAPTSQSQQEDLRKIAHPNFGKVSLLGLEQQFNVSFDQKIATIEAYLSEYKKKIGALQKIIQTQQKGWMEIDQSSMPGKQKTQKKKDSLHTLASDIVPKFLHQTSVTPPHPKGASFEALAESYLNAYPCLRPFFLQMIPTLILSNEKLPEWKPSQIVLSDLSSMQDKERRKHLTGVMKETLQTLFTGYYVNSKGKKVTLNLKTAIASLYCEPKAQEIKPRTGKYTTHIFLDKKDCLIVANECGNRGLKTAVLDAGSNGHFGGGYEKGSSAQEENLCYRGALSVVVDKKQGKQKNNFYPLSHQSIQACLYAPHIPIFREEEAKGYAYLDQPFETNIIISAAFDFNEEHQKKHGVQPQDIKRLVIDSDTDELRLPDSETFHTKEKLRNILHTAEKNGNEAIVLIPFGCGAFCNPPKQICEIILELAIEEFPHSFKEIHFSVIDDHNTGKAHNPRGNYIEFKETIENAQSLGLLKKIDAQFTIVD